MDNNDNIRLELIRDNCRNFVLEALEKIKNFSMETYSHSINVANKSVILGKKLNLSKQDLVKLYTAGLVHDVGKIFVDINLLEKPKCTSEEREQIKLGHIAGTKKYHEGKIDDDIFQIAYHHHEKLNGTGYPQGLKAEELTYLDRILQTCDIIDALLQHRSYRPSLDSSSVIKIIDNWVNVGEMDKFYTDIAKETFLVNNKALCQ